VLHSCRQVFLAPSPPPLEHIHPHKKNWRALTFSSAFDACCTTSLPRYTPLIPSFFMGVGVEAAGSGAYVGLGVHRQVPLSARALRTKYTTKRTQTPARIFAHTRTHRQLVQALLWAWASTGRCPFLLEHSAPSAPPCAHTDTYTYICTHTHTQAAGSGAFVDFGKHRQVPLSARALRTKCTTMRTHRHLHVYLHTHTRAITHSHTHTHQTSTYTHTVRTDTERARTLSGPQLMQRYAPSSAAV